MKNKKAIIFIGVVVAILILNQIFGWSQYFSVEEIVSMLSRMVEENFWLAVLIYLVFTVVGCVVLALPGVTFAIVAGILFGPVIGTLACVTGATIGAIAAFLAGRFFLKDTIKPKIENNKILKTWLFDETGKHELFILMITRLVPIFPYNLQNFAYGVTDIKFSTYAIGSFLFMIPGTAMYTVAAAGMASGESGIWYIAIAVVIGVIVMSVGAFLKKRYVQPEEVAEETSCEDEVADCVRCHLCQKNCGFLTKYELDVVDVLKKPELLYHCYLCGNCTAVCPKKIDGRELILDAKKKLVASNNDKVTESGYGMLQLEKVDYLFKNYKDGKTKSVLFPGCNFPSFYPETTKRLVELFKKHGIGVVYDCCGKPVAELGLAKKEEEITKRIETRLKEDGVEEVIALCPNCYYFLKNHIQIPVVSVYEKLAELGMTDELTKVKAGRTFLPCPDKESHKLLDEIASLTEGEMEIIAGTQCCGLGGCAYGKDAELSKKLASQIGEGEETYVYCASCASILERNGAKNVKHYLSEILGVCEKPDTKNSLMNRFKKKF